MKPARYVVGPGKGGSIPNSPLVFIVSNEGTPKPPTCCQDARVEQKRASTRPARQPSTGILDMLQPLYDVLSSIHRSHGLHLRPRQSGHLHNRVDFHAHGQHTPHSFLPLLLPALL